MKLTWLDISIVLFTSLHGNDRMGAQKKSKTE